MKLWLDDVRDPSEHGCVGWTWVKTVEEAKALLQTLEVTKASLDHDLSIKAMLGDWEKEITGYDLLCWMEENDIWPCDGVRIHTQNPAGRQRMEQVVRKHYGTLI